MIALVAALSTAGIAYSVTKDEKWRIFNAVGAGIGSYLFVISME